MLPRESCKNSLLIPASGGVKRRRVEEEISGVKRPKLSTTDSSSLSSDRDGGLSRLQPGGGSGGGGTGSSAAAAGGGGGGSVRSSLCGGLNSGGGSGGGGGDGGLLRPANRYLRLIDPCRCPVHMTSRSSGGGELEDYSMELIQRIDELREKRDEITKMLQAEEEEKAGIQKDLVVLTKRLAEIDESLSRKYAYINEYDKTIEDVEAAYGKIVESSQALLHVLKTEAIHIANKR